MLCDSRQTDDTYVIMQCDWTFDNMKIILENLDTSRSWQYLLTTNNGFLEYMTEDHRERPVGLGDAGHIPVNWENKGSTKYE